MADSVIRAICSDCFESGQVADDCLMCLALNGKLDPGSSAGSFLRALNHVGARANARGAEEKTSMAQRVDSRQALRMLPPDYATIPVEAVPDSRTPDEIAEDNAIKVQMMTEGLEPETDESGNLIRRVTLNGRGFRIASSVGLMPLMEFAHHANSGMTTSDMGSLAAMFNMLRDCIYDGPSRPATPEDPNPPTEWDEFRAHATATKAGAEELMGTVEATIELLTAKPTRPDSGSSAQSRQTPVSLTDTSSGQREGLIPVSDLGRVASTG